MNNSEAQKRRGGWRAVCLLLSWGMMMGLAGCGPSVPYGKNDPDTNQLAQPPWETFVRAGPGAAQDVDLETLNGQAKIPEQKLPNYDATLTGTTVAPDSSDEGKGVAVPPPVKDDKLAQVSQPIKDEEKILVPDEEQAGKSVPIEEKGEAQVDAAKNEGAKAADIKDKSSESKAEPPKTVIKAVAVLPVHGGTAESNAELTTAMRQTLTTAGWQVLDHAAENALTIDGAVVIAAASGDKQKVTLEWLVKTPEGETIGSIKQANDVPAGSLDKGWGEAAVAVTEAAATGIFELVNKLR